MVGIFRVVESAVWRCGFFSAFCYDTPGLLATLARDWPLKSQFHDFIVAP
jgi:hypothetical protein